MRRSPCWLLGLCMMALHAGCTRLERAEEGVDRWSFGLTGGTVFSEPFQVTTKQLHFDTGKLFGQDVVLEGKIERKGEAGTHLVLSDAEGRILVVMTQLESSFRELEDPAVGGLRVLGRLERGKKGLPYLLAKAVKVSHAPAPTEAAVTTQ